MIYYYSGTGNTRYVAHSLAGHLGMEVRNIPDCNVMSERFTGKSLGILFPVYSWGVPPIVARFIRELPESFVSEVIRQGADVWVVMTCGDDVAETPQMITSMLAKRGLHVRSIQSIVMPNNYVILPGFDIDPHSVATQKLINAPGRIKTIAERIAGGYQGTDVARLKFSWLKTHVVYPLFLRFGISPRRWAGSKDCNGCGKCAAVCPAKNITMSDTGPKWESNCISCLACYHYCPQKAVHYGKATTGKGHYHCPLK